MKKILIADDHSAIRSGLKLILAKEFKDVEFGEAANGPEVFRRVKEKNWSMIILDMNLPGRNGLEIVKQLKEEKINAPVLIFSFHPEEQVGVRALRAGASGYISKGESDEELLKAINLILSGRKYITASLAEQMAEQLENPQDKLLHELLSDREYQTLILIGSGKTVSQIAEELSLSIPTVSTYRARILEKMGMKTNAELANYSIRNNLV